MSHFIVNKHGHHVQHSQHINVPHMKHESIIIPSTSNPTWGGYFVIDFRERNCVLHDLTLQFNVSALTGYTGTNATSPRYTPAFFGLVELNLFRIIMLLILFMLINNLYLINYLIMMNKELF